MEEVRRRDHYEEEMCRRFSKDTGLMCPMKDAPAMVGNCPEYQYEFRRDEWDKWLKTQEWVIIYA